MIKLNIDHQDHPANEHTGDAFTGYSAMLCGENHDDQHVLERIYAELERHIPKGAIELIRDWQEPKLMFYDSKTK